MAQFNPKTEYTITTKNINIEDFHKYGEEFVTRPPYQRKNVWSRSKQQALLDSLFRRYYVPRIVLREVRLADDKTVSEVIDGQQRISTVQDFYRGVLPLPKTLKDVHAELPGKTYENLPADMRRFVDRIAYQADIVTGIDDPLDRAHQKIATEIFWRLQQGESLNYMEEAHSKLSSLVRNFVVKYADDQRFDYRNYEPIEGNSDKHDFFKLIDRNNNRMQHLALLVRFLIIEKAGNIVDIRNSEVVDIIESTQQEDGIGNYGLEKEDYAKRVLQTMNLFHDVFKDDPAVQDGSPMPEFRIEYFIISVYVLLRHLQAHYVFDKSEKKLFHDFVIHFHERWRSERQTDTDILRFSNSRQQSSAETEMRDRIIRQAFFEFASERGHEMLTKDKRRGFSELERINIYRNNEGLCQECLREGKPEEEAAVAWREYEADHVIPHAKGGLTDIANSQVLCRYHNKVKGASS